MFSHEIMLGVVIDKTYARTSCIDSIQYTSKKIIKEHRFKKRKV